MSLLAILYKAWRINSRQYFISLIKILLPLLPIILYVKLSNNEPSGHFSWNQSAIIYPKHFKNELLEPHTSALKVIYYPKSVFTDKIMENVANQIKRDFIYFGADKESDILKWFMNETDPNYGRSEFELYGITFDVNNSTSKPPNHFSYTISGIQENLPDTDNLFPVIQFPGPMEAGAMYFNHQFIRLKVSIDEAFLSTIGVASSNWSVQYFPYPAHESHSGNDNTFRDNLGLFLAFTFMYTFTTLGSFSLNEKKSGITERLRMVGLNDFMILLSYILHGFIIYVFSTAISAFLLQMKYESAIIFPNSNFFILWIVLILFCLQCSVFFLAFSSLFNNPSLASTICTLAYCAPCFTILSNTHYSTATQGLLSLLPITYLHWAFQNIIGFEGTNLGATFSTIFKVPPSGKCGIPLSGLILISLCSTVLLCLIYLYIIQVKPGPYGSAKPWHFIFPTYICRINPSNILKRPSNEKTSPGLYEAVPDNVEVGLRISNLRKTFGNVISVKDLSLDIYVGQITALLGHNGAGKTTTLNMITGMLKPTSGSIHYKGYSIFSDMRAFRRDLGLCPQEDMLIGGLSVWDHLIIFSMIKGLSHEERQTSCEEALHSTLLSEKKKELVNNLSGGMKRKLCLAIALIDNPKVLILDEPTSGLDPESRREIWNILLKFREDRVMIITTHFMAEADVLGDQIAIMDHGEIKCYGSPMFLKKHYGAGYNITLCFNETADFDSIINYITSEVPDASVLNKTNQQIVFNIPSSFSKDFPRLFKTLESEDIYPISRIGISCTTMDDVFMKVREEADKDKSGDQPEDSILFKSEPALTTRRRNLLLNFLQRFFSLIQKNILYMKSSWATLLIMVVIMPFLFSYIAMSGTSGFLDSQNTKPISYDLNIYGSTEVLLDGPATSEIMNNFITLIKKDGHHLVNVKELNKDNIIDGLLYVADNDEVKFRQSLIVAGGFNETVPNMLLSTIAIHSPVIGINLLYNSVLKGDQLGKAYSVSTKCNPISIYSGLCGKEMPFLLIFVPLTFVFWCLAIVSIVGLLGTKPAHIERNSLLKHLQLMTGLSPFTYWLSIFVWDLLVYSFSIIFCFIVLKIFDVHGLLAVADSAGVYFFITLLYGVSGFWNAYCFTYFFKTPTGAFNLFYLLNSILSIVAFICLKFIPSTSKWVCVNYILRLFPVSSFTYAIQLLISKSVERLSCTTCQNAFALPFCTPEMNHGSLIDIELERELLFLGLDWIMYFVILMLIDFEVFTLLLEKIDYFRFGLIENSKLENIEADVAKERDRVDAALTYSSKNSVLGEGPTNPLVIVDGLGKKYSKNFTAVYEISFASKEGECFGLLGVNGAGKTTTFNILSGVQRPTQGRALIKGEDLRRKKRLCLSNMGYCPQFSALSESLTGRQLIKLFANLRLVNPSQREEIVDKWIHLLGLEEIADRCCGTYSGGNKRKLSAALAFINNPAVILLDEPTSGVDPVTRRNIWSALKNCQNNKQTIIISSHSMDECEAVCDRITIMVNGYMQCIGNLQRLQELYGQGFVLLIKLKDNPEDIRNSLKERIANDFGSNASLKDEHLMLLHYHISDTSYKLSTLFGIMENICQDFQVIEEYSISDSNLEQIFLSFAKKKNE